MRKGLGHEKNLDFNGWVQTHNDLISKYGNTFQGDDGRNYSGEIRHHKDIEKYDWLVQSGKYDGQRGRFDAHIASGDAASLAQVDDVIDRLTATADPVPTM